MYLTIQVLMNKEWKYFSTLFATVGDVERYYKLHEIKAFTRKFKELMKFHKIKLKKVQEKKYTFWIDENTWIIILPDDKGITDKEWEIKHELDSNSKVFVAYVIILTNPIQWKRIQGSLAEVMGEH